MATVFVGEGFMTKRRDRLKELFAGAGSETGAPDAQALETKAAKTPTPSPAPAVQKEPAAAASVKKAPRPRAASGAVKAMGLSLGQMAESLKDQPGERIVLLDPAHIEPSPVLDRMAADPVLDDSFEDLKQSLKDRGQQVPVMVRRHPDPVKRADGWYQAAYGHRRIRAARELGVEIMALVRDLSDDALILAQGKENAERRNLSFIERAFFARSLIEHGFERAMVQEALAVHKTEMTRLLQVADKVPYRIARAIGPAPKAGRPRWLQLAELIDGEAAEVIAEDEITCGPFLQVGSDERFQRLFTRLSNRKRAKPSGQAITCAKGTPIASLKGATLRMDKALPAGFTQYLAERLPDLWDAFEEQRDSVSGEGETSSS